VANATELQAHLEQRRASLHSLRTLARLRYQDSQESSSSRQALIIERPNHVRVEVLSLLGTVFLLTVNGPSLAAYIPDEKTVYRGAASPENLWRYTRLWMPIDDLVDLLLATPHFPPGGKQTVRLTEDGQQELIQTIPDGEISVRFSDTLLPASYERRRSDGTPLWQVHYEDYERIDHSDVARKIVVEVPRFSRTIQLTLSESEPNAVLDSQWFMLQTPAGNRTVDLDTVED